MGSSTDVETKWHMVKRWQRLATQKLGWRAMEQYLQWSCQTTMDDPRGTEEYKCDANELLDRYANVYTALQLTSKKTPKALGEPKAGAQKGLGPKPPRKEQVLARLVRSAIAWQCVSIMGFNGMEPDYLEELNKAFENKIKYAKKTDELVPQLLKAYHESMEWFPEKFKSRSEIKSCGRKRPPKIRDGACVKNLLESRDGFGLAAREQGWLGFKNFAKKDLKALPVVVEKVTEPLPMVLGYGEDSILEPMDVQTPMKVFFKEEGEAT